MTLVVFRGPGLPHLLGLMCIGYCLVQPGFLRNSWVWHSWQDSMSWPGAHAGIALATQDYISPAARQPRVIDSRAQRGADSHSDADVVNGSILRHAYRQLSKNPFRGFALVHINAY